jgi:hypothetical protein
MTITRVTLVAAIATAAVLNAVPAQAQVAVAGMHHDPAATAAIMADEVLAVRFLCDWNGTDGSHYHAGDEAPLPINEAYDLRSRQLVDAVDSADALWAQWEGVPGD